MTSRRKTTAIEQVIEQLRERLCRALLALLLPALLLLPAGVAWAAQVVGTVVHLSGPLLDRKGDGTVKVLALKSEVESGDTLVSEKNTYAQVRFIDNSEITLRPGTTFRIEQFAYESGKPEADSAAFSLIKGGLRAITGLLGKRNKEKFSLKTPSATIGIRGTTFIAQWVAPDAVGGGLAPGLHLAVTDGAIVVSNDGGTLDFQAGQFGHVPDVHAAPLPVPANPGLQFVPPASFGDGGTAGTPGAGGSVQAQGAVDCVVR